VVQLNIKFTILKEQSLFYGDIPDDDPIDYHDVKVDQGSPEELVTDMDGLGTSAEQAGMSRDDLQSLQKLGTDYEDIFRIKLGADPPANMTLLFVNLSNGADHLRMSTRKHDYPQLEFMRDKYANCGGI
jgi:hypothetical protein